LTLRPSFPTSTSMRRVPLRCGRIGSITTRLPWLSLSSFSVLLRKAWYPYFFPSSPSLGRLQHGVPGGWRPPVATARPECRSCPPSGPRTAGRRRRASSRTGRSGPSNCSRSSRGTASRSRCTTTPWSSSASSGTPTMPRAPCTPPCTGRTRGFLLRAETARRSGRRRSGFAAGSCRGSSSVEHQGAALLVELGDLPIVRT